MQSLRIFKTAKKLERGKKFVHWVFMLVKSSIIQQNNNYQFI